MIKMSDIAVHAGVSRTTVSCVLNEKHLDVGISEETRHRVIKVARELGYRRNEAARQMVSGRSRALGFVIGVNENDVVGKILTGVLGAAEEREYSVKVFLLDPQSDPGPVIARASEARIAGIISLYISEPVLQILHTEMARCGDVPVAVLDSSFPQSRGLRVLSDDAAGMHAVVDHLVGLGHSRIAFVGGPINSGASMFREASFLAAMSSHHLEVAPWQVVHGDWIPERVAAVVTQLFQTRSAGAAPTALACADDTTAMAAVRTLRALGYRTPEDVSVVGFADLYLAALCDPPLTTVSQPFQEMGRAAVRMLIDGTKDGVGGRDYLLPTQLIVRDSTAPAKMAGLPHS